MQYLGINDGGIGGVGGTGGSGGNIVAVALGELGKEDSLEVPPGSNQCKYNDWYWGEGSAQDRLAFAGKNLRCRDLVHDKAAYHKNFRFCHCINLLPVL